MIKSIKLNPFVISILSIIIGLLAYSVGVPFLDLVELKTIDLRFHARGKISPRPEVVLAVIDNKSVVKEGKWVWPRSKIADLVNKLSKAGAKVIAFDIVFAEPDGKIVVQTIDKIKREINNLKIQNRKIEKYLEDLKLQADNDKLLADAIKNSRAKVVLGYFFEMEAKDIEHISKEELRIHEVNSKGSMYKFVRYESSAAQNVALMEAAAPQSNIKQIADVTEFAGFFSMTPDPDGVFRWIPGIYRFRDKLYAPLSLNTVSAYLDTPLSVNVADYGIESIKIGRIYIPTDELGRVLINYRGKAKTFPHISVTDILNDSVGDNVLKDKIVLVGATAFGIYDLRVTPFSSVFPGLEIHANVVDSVLSKDFLRQPGWSTLFDFMAIVISGSILGLVIPRFGAALGASVSASVFIGYILLCQYFFSNKGLILNLMYPTSVMILIYVGITMYKYIVESSQKRFIKDAFSTYLAPSVVKQIIDSPEKLALGGEQRDITAFFSDIQGFTSISEKLTPPELVELLNQFLTEMTDIILNFEGTVDKFEGDAIIALFGAPNYLENHAATAVI
ncbi:CHASE2 domain-containing protein [Thermodesulfobacteriota bacterium]